MKKIILHLCADTGSDSWPYQMNDDYEVILVGKDIGVENFHAPKGTYGIFANPVCLEFSTARAGGKARNPDEGMVLVNECLRIIEEARQLGDLQFWVLENPARGVLHKYIGQPKAKYQPYEYGSPWTKATALWGDFNMPAKIYKRYNDLPKDTLIPELYVRPYRVYTNGRIRKATGVPSLAGQHKSAYHLIDEFKHLPEPDSDMELRSLCSQKFAQAFMEVNQ